MESKTPKTRDERHDLARQKREEVLKKFKAAFPILWRKTDSFDVGIGWEGLLWDCCSKIESSIQSVANLYPIEELPKIAQIKEKFGGLRFYLDGRNEQIDLELEQAITDAELLSEQTCEECGCPGEIRTTWPESTINFGWIRCLCEKCWFTEAEDRASGGRYNLPAEVKQWLQKRKNEGGK